jgi:uncharacterized membrane protein
MNDVYAFCFITNLIITIFCAVMFSIVPVLTRKAFLFGVKVPESAQANPDTQRLKKHYVTAILCSSAVVLALEIIQYNLFADKSILAVMYFPLLLVAIQFAVYVPCWKRAVRLKAENNWRVSTVVTAETGSARSRGSLSDIPWGYYVISLVAMIICTVITFLKYDELPAKIATHWDFSMQPDAWAQKSLWTMLQPSVWVVLLLVILVGSSVMVVKAKLQVSPQNPALSYAQHRVYRRWMGHGFGILMVGFMPLFISMMLAPVYGLSRVVFGGAFVILMICVVPIIAVGIKAGQGGCRLNPPVSEADVLAAGHGAASDSESNSSNITKSGSTNDKTATPDMKSASRNAKAGTGKATFRGDDKYWALGMFYHNPDDPAVLVEDRFGSNIGLNYSRLISKLCIGLLVIVLVGAYVMVTILL